MRSGLQDGPGILSAVRVVSPKEVPMHAGITRFSLHRMVQLLALLLCASTLLMACPSKDGYTGPESTESTARTE